MGIDVARDSLSDTDKSLTGANDLIKNCKIKGFS